MERHLLRPFPKMSAHQTNMFLSDRPKHFSLTKSFVDRSLLWPSTQVVYTCLFLTRQRAAERLPSSGEGYNPCKPIGYPEGNTWLYFVSLVARSAVKGTCERGKSHFRTNYRRRANLLGEINRRLGHTEEGPSKRRHPLSPLLQLLGPCSRPHTFVKGRHMFRFRCSGWLEGAAAFALRQVTVKQSTAPHGMTVWQERVKNLQGSFFFFLSLPYLKLSFSEKSKLVKTFTGQCFSNFMGFIWRP